MKLSSPELNTVKILLKIRGGHWAATQRSSSTGWHALACEQASCQMEARAPSADRGEEAVRRDPKSDPTPGRVPSRLVCSEMAVRRS